MTAAKLKGSVRLQTTPPFKGSYSISSKFSGLLSRKMRLMFKILFKFVMETKIQTNLLLICLNNTKIAKKMLQEKSKRSVQHFKCFNLLQIQLYQKLLVKFQFPQQLHHISNFDNAVRPEY
jgi:hypothetical protein